MLQHFLSFGLWFNLTFPNAYYSPSGEFEINIVGIVTSNIHRDLMSPEINIRLWQTEILAPLMPMPKTSIDKNHSLIFSKDNIRRSRQPFVVDTITQSPREKILPHNHLRLRIFPLYGRHIPTPLLRRLYVCHRKLLSTFGFGHNGHNLIQCLGDFF